jgi:hypothetical protein
MFFQNLFAKNQARRFTFTPYYYDPSKDAEDRGEPQPRIQFRRLRRRPPSSPRSLRAKIFFVIILLFLLYYFNDLVREDQSKFKIESIQIEETTNE